MCPVRPGEMTASDTGAAKAGTGSLKARSLRQSQRCPQRRFIEKIVADFGLPAAQHRNQRIEAADQLGIAIDVDFSPAERLVRARECHQRLAHRIAQVALLAVVERQFQAGTTSIRNLRVESPGIPARRAAAPAAPPTCRTSARRRSFRNRRPIRSPGCRSS